MTNLVNDFRGAMGYKDYQWVNGFMSFMTKLGIESLSEENLEDHKYELMVRSEWDNIPYLELRNNTLNKTVFNQIQLETVMNKLGTLQPEIGRPTSLLEEGATDPIFFEEGCMVTNFRLGRILIALIATGFSEEPEITKVNGEKFNSWSEVTDYYRNDDELENFFESEHAFGVELPRFEIKVYFNRYHNPKIDEWMESNGYPKEYNKHGIADYKIMNPSDCIDWNEKFNHAINYNGFVNMFKDGTVDLDTIREVYKDYI